MATARGFWSAQVSLVEFAIGRFNRFSSFRLFYASFCIFLFLIPKCPSYHPASSLHLHSSLAWTAGDKIKCPISASAERTGNSGAALGGEGDLVCPQRPMERQALCFTPAKRKETTSPHASAHTANSHGAGEPARKEFFQESRS